MSYCLDQSCRVYGLLYQREAVACFTRTIDQLQSAHLPGKQKNLACGDITPYGDREFDTCHLRHHNVGNEIIRRLSSCRFERRRWIGEGNSVEQIHLQDHDQQLCDVYFVVDDKNAWMLCKRIF